MKAILYAVVFSLSGFAHAESALETDDSFFSGSKIPYEDDELDRVHKKSELTKTIEGEKKVESNVKDEFSTVTPGTMPDYEARAMDDKIVAENQRRQKAILDRIRSSSGAVQACVETNVQNFQGTHATVIWMVAANGGIEDMAIKSTDIENNEIQKCIEAVAANLDFSAARTDHYKKSHVEYTYKFKKKVVKPVTRAASKQAIKKASRRTASQ